MIDSIDPSCKISEPLSLRLMLYMCKALSIEW